MLKPKMNMRSEAVGQEDNRWCAERWGQANIPRGQYAEDPGRSQSVLQPCCNRSRTH